MDQYGEDESFGSEFDQGDFSEMDDDLLNEDGFGRFKGKKMPDDEDNFTNKKVKMQEKGGSSIGFPKQQYMKQDAFVKKGIKDEEDDLEMRALRMQQQDSNNNTFNLKSVDLTRQQQQLIKDMAQELIKNLEIPSSCTFLPYCAERMRTTKERDQKNQFDKICSDQELLMHLNNCKEDLYKQLFFNYREFFQTNIHRRWTRAIIKQISQQIIEDREQYSKIQVKKGKVPKEFLWYHATVQLTAKLMKESDETWLDLPVRVQLKMHHMKLISLILQIESNEFAEIFKQAFE